MKHYFLPCLIIGIILCLFCGLRERLHTLDGNIIELNKNISSRINVVRNRCDELRCTNNKLSLINNSQTETLSRLTTEYNELLWRESVLKRQLTIMVDKYSKLQKDFNILEKKLEDSKIQPLPPGGPQ